MTLKTSMLWLVMPTGGVTLMPLYVKLMPLAARGHSPAARRCADYRTGARLQPIEHVGAHQTFLTRTDQLVAGVAKPDTDFWSVPQVEADLRRSTYPATLIGAGKP
jgi:hypothetical protein